MRVYLAADHGGFSLKEVLKTYLSTQSYDVVDEGAHALDPADDYPDFMYPAAQKVGADLDSRGIFLCRSGAGAAIVGNKVKGVRAVVARTKEEAKHAREHNDANVIALSSDVLTAEEAQDIVATFLETPFSGEERHLRRLKKILKIEGAA
ncbi:ribose-5-phosphate isomerase [Candidatus Kaiserbacteria bacterium RIFCSPLOWO2_01_FULL_54_13]|uniref:Ribose-5-phosphate isomerase n=1 Tax=Candidatus Kaiserbacteria bacterium RIFCSPLOWO2_01_FULL_54_13 TaxID=1798512 RepID=A0A1F6F174_9BACT|nr:MAG: ribose-5-phosphate isomerase [Candidatus Kaiserbacteria bacterium RIFCSPLOWO2_01_FULL_54_13]